MLAKKLIYRLALARMCVNAILYVKSVGRFWLWAADKHTAGLYFQYDVDFEFGFEFAIGSVASFVYCTRLQVLPEVFHFFI